MDFKKYQYSVKKKLQSSKQKQKKTTLKEIRLRPNIGKGDLEIKIKQIKKFLSERNKVKVTI